MEEIMFAGMSCHAWISIFTMAAVFAVLICTKLPADFVFLGSLVILIVTGTLKPEEAFSGFNSSAVLTIGFMFVIVAGLTETGVLHWITRRCLGKPKTYPKAILRLMTTVSAASAFLSNTTVVAMFLQVVMIWSKKMSIKPSKLLIPLSYASILGGLCTIIGTSTNLVVSALYANETGTVFGLFEVGKLGIICIIAGFIITVLFRNLLPERNPSGEQFRDSAGYTTELLVPNGSPCSGKSVKEAGLVQVPGGQIIEIIHADKEIVFPVSEEEPLSAGDRIVFSGIPERIMQLKASHGLTGVSEPLYSRTDNSTDRTLIQTVVPEYSSLIGRTFIARNYEKLYNIILVAVSRDGKRINQNARETLIMAGDILLLECNQNFLGQVDKLNKDIIPLNTEEKDIPVSKKAILSSSIMIAVVLLATFNVLPISVASLIGMLAMLATRCCTASKARSSISGSTLTVFAASLGLGTAIQTSGLAHTLATSIQGFCGTDPHIALLVICASACLLSEFISNAAAAAIFFPIAMQTAGMLGVSPVPFMFALMVSTSSFATPIGAPAHLLVYGPGGYKFTDFMHLGILMDAMVVSFSTIFAPLIWPF